MRRKMTDNFITALGFVSVVNIVYDIIMNINNSEKSGLAIVSMILLTIIIGYLYFSKNQRIDLYGTLFTMAKNNKLHAIREMIFIIHKSICGNSNSLENCGKTLKYLFRKRRQKLSKYTGFWRLFLWTTPDFVGKIAVFCSRFRLSVSPQKFCQLMFFRLYYEVI